MTSLSVVPTRTFDLDGVLSNLFARSLIFAFRFSRQLTGEIDVDETDTLAQRAKDVDSIYEEAKDLRVHLSESKASEARIRALLAILDVACSQQDQLLAILLALRPSTSCPSTAANYEAIEASFAGIAKEFSRIRKEIAIVHGARRTMRVHRKTFARLASL
jgi:hypothetical protein